LPSISRVPTVTIVSGNASPLRSDARTWRGGGILANRQWSFAHQHCAARARCAHPRWTIQSPVHSPRVGARRRWVPRTRQRRRRRPSGDPRRLAGVVTPSRRSLRFLGIRRIRRRWAKAWRLATTHVWQHRCRERYRSRVLGSVTGRIRTASLPTRSWPARAALRVGRANERGRAGRGS